MFGTTFALQFRFAISRENAQIGSGEVGKLGQKACQRIGLAFEFLVSFCRGCVPFYSTQWSARLQCEVWPLNMADKA